jgi:hypothetical protein
MRSMCHIFVSHHRPGTERTRQLAWTGRGDLAVAVGRAFASRSGCRLSATGQTGRSVGWAAGVEHALAYWAVVQDEIDELISRHRASQYEALAAWERRRALGSNCQDLWMKIS